MVDENLFILSQKRQAQFDHQHDSLGSATFSVGEGDEDHGRWIEERKSDPYQRIQRRSGWLQRYHQPNNPPPNPTQTVRPRRLPSRLERRSRTAEQEVLVGSRRTTLM